MRKSISTQRSVFPVPNQQSKIDTTYRALFLDTLNELSKSKAPLDQGLDSSSQLSVEDIYSFFSDENNWISSIDPCPLHPYPIQINSLESLLKKLTLPSHVKEEIQAICQSITGSDYTNSSIGNTYNTKKEQLLVTPWHLDTVQLAPRPNIYYFTITFSDEKAGTDYLVLPYPNKEKLNAVLHEKLRPEDLKNEEERIAHIVDNISYWTLNDPKNQNWLTSISKQTECGYLYNIVNHYYHRSPQTDQERFHAIFRYRIID